MKVLMGSRSQDWLSHCLLGEFFSSDYFFKLCSLFVMLFSTVKNMRK